MRRGQQDDELGRGHAGPALSTIPLAAVVQQHRWFSGTVNFVVQDEPIDQSVVARGLRLFPGCACHIITYQFRVST
jgi:hypothetical protein